MSMIEIRKTSITYLDTDAIVNAANEGLQAGGGVCGAIFSAAGHAQLQAACDKIGGCKTGSAVITPGFLLKAKYIIHAVGPVWTDGSHNEPKLLYSAYQSSLKLAVQNECRSIAFPLISAGIYGYPAEEAFRKAIQACNDFLKKGNEINIVFAVLNDDILEIGRRTLNEIAPEYRVAEEDDWTIFEMPARNETFFLDRKFSPDQMDALRKGNVPEEMEDKWFWYMKDNTLFAFRSWTGYCIYIIELSPDGHHKVTVNQDPAQYTRDLIPKEVQKLNALLDWWTVKPYDYYNEWLWEVMTGFDKKGPVIDKLKIAGKEVDAVFFHKPEEQNGYLSNWYASPFQLDGISFSSTEQYIMYQKCKLFGDDASASAVLATNDPKKQQDIGRKASGYIPSVWEGVRQLIAIRGCRAKFSQNEDLKEKLLNTGDAYLVECAYSDKIWACGVTLKQKERFDADKWKGQNILGFALMEVRSAIREEKDL